MLLDPETFRMRLRGFERYAWRWECQPVYNFPAELEQVERFVAGEEKPEGYNSAWLDNVRSISESGRTIGRVRAVHQPLTDYEHCQLSWVVPDSVQAGEDIRILDVKGLGLPEQDFWLFDDSIVVRLNFSEDGSLINIEQLEDAELSTYLEWKDTALRNAVPYADYVARAQRP
ncbi:DUF6879 family protein [Haloechinothrix halophila]|uniref:DUF6879 family protein n=1 Tax=Haloechinothrix halophila TaxID=1069073 RepID=UPI0009FDF01D|nr:DUF6879 family protein [Haloechinothrix halophila]